MKIIKSAKWLALLLAVILLWTSCPQPSPSDSSSPLTPAVTMDIAGTWYDLPDTADTPADDSDNIEEVLVIDDIKGTFQTYARRHGVDFYAGINHLNSETFYEIQRGTYSYMGDQLTFTPAMMNFYTVAILIDEDINTSTEYSTEEELDDLIGYINSLLGLELDLADELILHDKAYYQTHLVNTGYIPQQGLDEMFAPATVTVSETNTFLTSDSSVSVRCMKFEGFEGLYKSSYLSTDADEGFREAYPSF